MPSSQRNKDVDYDERLGREIVGRRFRLDEREFEILSFLQKGEFSYVYQVKEYVENGSPTSSNGKLYALKVTPMVSKDIRKRAEQEAAMMLAATHPTIVRAYAEDFISFDGSDTDHVLSSSVHLSSPHRRASTAAIGSDKVSKAKAGSKIRRRSSTTTTTTNKNETPPDKPNPPQHVLLMEYCDGGSVQDACDLLMYTGKRFDRHTLLAMFGSICNAVAFLHAQEIRIVHRSIHPTNFVMKKGIIKLCDFDSICSGRVELVTKAERDKARDVIDKTTVPNYRAPEMINLTMTKKLTTATDVWALGCSLYAMAFFKDRFKRDLDPDVLNQRILNAKFKIPMDHEYGDDFDDLLRRMLEVDPKYRADTTEIILCLSAMLKGIELPPRKRVPPSDGQS